MIDAVLNRFQVHFAETMANVFAPKQLDAIFRDTSARQREGELLFSAVVGLRHLALLRTKPSLHAAYQGQHEEIGVLVRSVYEKVKLPVSREIGTASSKRHGSGSRRPGASAAESASLVPGPDSGC